VNIIYNDAYQLSDPDITYVTKEELLKLKIEPVFQDQYRITDDYQELYYVCPPNAICITPSPYKKIN
jgi:hypothetical protein